MPVATDSAFRDAGSLDVVDDDALPSFGLRLSPPQAHTRGTIDAATAFGVAMSFAPPSYPADRPSVTLALGRRKWGWPDHGPIERLIYVVRWENTTWMPSGGPAPARGEQAGRLQSVTGPQTTLVDAHTGARLGVHQTGAARGERAGQATRSDAPES